MEPRKVQLRHGGLAAFRRSEISRGIGPAAREAGSQENDRVLGHRPLLRLGMGQIVDGDLIVRAPLTLLSDVHNHSGPEEALKRDLIDALMSLREVHRRIEM